MSTKEAPQSTDSDPDTQREIDDNLSTPTRRAAPLANHGSRRDSRYEMYRWFGAQGGQNHE